VNHYVELLIAERRLKYPEHEKEILLELLFELRHGIFLQSPRVCHRTIYDYTRLIQFAFKILSGFPGSGIILVLYDFPFDHEVIKPPSPAFGGNKY
jgi:hypothetical protein